MEEIRSLVTLAAFSSFVGIVWWAYAPGRKKRLDEIAKTMLDEDT